MILSLTAYSCHCYCYGAIVIGVGALLSELHPPLYDPLPKFRDGRARAQKGGGDHQASAGSVRAPGYTSALRSATPRTPPI